MVSRSQLYLLAKDNPGAVQTPVARVTGPTADLPADDVPELASGDSLILF